MILKQAVELMEARKRGTCIPAAKEAEAWRMVHRAADDHEAKIAAAVVVDANGVTRPLPTNVVDLLAAHANGAARLIPITVIDFYPKEPR